MRMMSGSRGIEDDNEGMTKIEENPVDIGKLDIVTILLHPENAD
jgi:hypothetical protein